MKQIFMLCLMALAVNCMGQAQHPQTFRMPSSMPGGDSFTVKQYFFVMLKEGAERTTDTALLNKLQAGHMANIERLHKEKKMLVAGPFGDGGNWAGIFIFDCDTREEVEQLLATDPMIKARQLSYDIRPWWTGMNCVFK